ncbi:MAG: cytochrome c [Gemmataceae bacterium]|nr:cytochrome c [Gemmataceae bacterium]
MYYVDANVFMNWTVGLVLAAAVVLLITTVFLSSYRGRRGRLMSYLYMLTALFGCFGLVVAALGFRGQHSAARPWHLFLDMKYQPKYTAQGGSDFFPDGRAMRLPVEGTIPYDGTDYAADAGVHAGPKPDFLKADRRYYGGVADPTATESKDGVTVPKDPTWADGQMTEAYFVARIPDAAVERAGGWEPLLKRGRQQFNVHCAACHGESGRGGVGAEAYGIVGAYGLSVAPANLTAELFRSQPDGQLYNTVANGKGSMPGYGHQVLVQDRWAIVSYIRVLQYAHNPPGGR